MHRAPLASRLLDGMHLVDEMYAQRGQVTCLRLLGAETVPVNSDSYYFASRGGQGSTLLVSVPGTSI